MNNKIKPKNPHKDHSDNLNFTWGASLALAAAVIFGPKISDKISSMKANFANPMKQTEIDMNMQKQHDTLKAMQASYSKATANTPASEKPNHNPF